MNDGPIGRLEAELERRTDQFRRADREADILRAELERLRVVAATAATLVDLMKNDLPPHISEAQQVEAYLSLRRIAKNGA
jgi:hypothetical protein